MSEILSDERLMDLAERAFRQSPNLREDWLRNECGNHPEVISQVQAYIESEIRMKGFLELPFAQGIQGVLLDQVGCEAFFLADFEAGQIVAGRFRIVRFLAKGGMGLVYEAFDEKLHRRVAIKFAKPGFGARLPPEVRHASEITHPNICRIFDIHTSNGPSGDIEFLTMEFLEGCTLADRLGNGGFDRSCAASIALQLCEGLAEAHRHGVIHGDLKCNNVILVPAAGALRERAVITDFGLARRRNLPDEPADLPRMGSGPIGGVRAYMAPELQQGQKPAMTSDVYAMGVILRELSLASRSDLPRKWKRTTKRCLESEPGRRFSSGEALVRALRPSSKKRWIIAAVAAVFAASLSGMLTYERASAPKRIVRLALLPFQGEGAESYRGITLSRAAAARFAQLKGSAQVRFEFLDRKDFTSTTTIDQVQAISAATHVIHGAIERPEPGDPQESEIVHAFLTETRTGVDKAEWRLSYESDLIQFAPVALAGLAAISLDLPPLLNKPDLNATARPYYTAGMQMIAAETQPDEAVFLLKRAAAADPGSALAYAGLAEAQLFQSRIRQDNNWLEQARQSVRQAELRNPDLAEVHLVSGWIDKTSGHYESAMKHFLRAIESQAGSATAWRRLGQTYEAAGQEGEALDALKRAVDLEPKYFKNHRELGIFFYRRNHFIEAVREFSAMALLVPNSPESHTLLGESWYQMSKYGNAESELKTAAKLQDTSDTEQTLGAVFWDQGKDEQAANHYLRALRIGPENSSIWMSLSFCYREQGLPSKAANAYRRGLAASGRELAQDPRNARAHASQAYFEAMLHDPAHAELDAAEALNLSHDDDTSQFAVMTYEAIGRRDLALRALKTSPELLSELRRYPWLAPLRTDAKKNGTLQ